MSAPDPRAELRASQLAWAKERADEARASENDRHAKAMRLIADIEASRIKAIHAMCDYQPPAPPKRKGHH